MDLDRINFEDMKKGDILLMEDVLSKMTHFAIAFAQAVVTHRYRASSNVTHAGIYDGQGNIMEAAGAAGLIRSKLEHKKAGLGYQVFRVKDKTIWKSIPDFAADLAYSFTEKREALRGINPRLAKNKGFGRYGGSGRGLFGFSGRGGGAKKSMSRIAVNPYTDREFYCSNFVVECYNIACEYTTRPPVFNVDYRRVTPKVLQGEMRNKPGRWDIIGKYVVPEIFRRR